MHTADDTKFIASPCKAGECTSQAKPSFAIAPSVRSRGKDLGKRVEEGPERAGLVIKGYIADPSSPLLMQGQSITHIQSPLFD